MNLESGRKTNLPLHELTVLARALDVPPVELLFPVGQVASVPTLPGEESDPMVAALWFGGSGPLHRNEAWKGSNLALYVTHDEHVRHFQMRARAAAGAARKGDGELEEHNRRYAADALSMLREVREAMTRRGLLLPELPADIPVEDS